MWLVSKLSRLHESPKTINGDLIFDIKLLKKKIAVLFCSVVLLCVSIA